VVFLLPWLGAVIAGTTDSVAPITLRPRATAAEVDWILEAVAPYLAVPASRADVTSTWAGIRPLAADPSADPAGTENILRDHVVVDEGDGMVTVTGGKWTTYRLMAEHAVDAAILAADKADAGTGGGGAAGAGAEDRLAARATPCRTPTVAVVGAHGYKPELAARLAQQRYRGAVRAGADRGGGGAGEASSSSSDGGGEAAVARHLARAYGDRAAAVAALAAAGDGTLARRLAPDHPVIAAEVVYAARHEYCQTPADFLARRSRLAFLDVRAAEAGA
jgi:glycerol-3-phosphate dehydrogenase